MKTLSVAAIIASMGVASTAGATNWASLSFSTTFEQAKEVVEAADTFMGSEVGKQFPGRVILQVSQANGNDPATHSFVPIYKSVADREAFLEKVRGSEAWAEFQESLTELTTPRAQVIYRTDKSWGDPVDTDVVWITHAFSVSDPAGFLAALETFMASPIEKNFPGQAYLSSVVAGGISPVTHVISVGYASETEMEQWTTKRNASDEWAAYIDASSKTADYLGASLGRTIKTWGPAKMKDFSQP